MVRQFNQHCLELMKTFAAKTSYHCSLLLRECPINQVLHVYCILHELLYGIIHIIVQQL